MKTIIILLLLSPLIIVNSAHGMLGMPGQNSTNPNNDLLFLSALQGHFEGIRQALSRGASINAQDVFGNTALHFAAAEKNLPVVKMLIEAGANVDLQNQFNLSPLFSALFTRPQNPEVLALLLAHSQRDNSPLFHSAITFPHIVQVHSFIISKYQFNRENIGTAILQLKKCDKIRNNKKFHYIRQKSNLRKLRGASKPIRKRLKDQLRWRRHEFVDSLVDYKSRLSILKQLLEVVITGSYPLDDKEIEHSTILQYSQLAKYRPEVKKVMQEIREDKIKEGTIEQPITEYIQAREIHGKHRC